MLFLIPDNCFVWIDTIDDRIGFVGEDESGVFIWNRGVHPGYQDKLIHVQ